MPVLTIDHEEYPSVIVIEYNSLYKNELINFIKNIKIKDNKEIVYTDNFFYKIINNNNQNVGLLTIDGRIEGYYYVDKENMLKYIYISFPYRRGGFGKLLLLHAIKLHPDITFDKGTNQGYNRLISSPLFEDALKGNLSSLDAANSMESFDDSGSSKEGELTLF